MVLKGGGCLSLQAEPRRESYDLFLNFSSEAGQVS